jgi:hypothetical protein
LNLAAGDWFFLVSSGNSKMMLDLAEGDWLFLVSLGNQENIETNPQYPVNPV